MDPIERPVEERFTLDLPVGRGAFGEIFRGVDRETGQSVAIKRLHAHRTDPVTAERFKLEARLLARVDSPHVVRYVAHGNDAQDQLWVVIEWLDGVDLSRRQKTEPLTCDEAVEVVRQAALGLAALHEAGIVHRDVKPSNFMIGSRGDGSVHVKLLDLGIARSAAEPTLTRAGFRIGTPAYMSPEQARGDEVVTAQSDIFSLGVVLYELLAGRRPFTGNDPYTMLAKIVLEDPPRLRTIAPAIPPELEAIVMRALDKTAEHRFASAREMATTLAQAPTTPMRLLSYETIDPSAATGLLRPAEPEPEHSHTLADDAPTAFIGGAGVAATDEQRAAVAVFAGIDEGEAFARQLAAFTMVVAAHGGVTYRTLGGRAIAVFGTARDEDDDVLRAARAASGAARVLPAARLAIATCRVRSNDAGLSGESIERGARLLERAQGGRAIGVDEAAARLLGAHFRIAGPEGDRVLLSAADEDDGGSANGAFGLRLETVGREREIAELEATFAECVHDRVARALLITAPAGAGKSRLVEDFVRRVGERPGDDEPACVWTARGDPMTAGSSFGLLAQLVRDAARVQTGEPIAVRQRKVRALADRYVARAQLDRVTEFLAELIGAAYPEGRSIELRAARADAVLMGDQIRRAFEDWLGAACSSHAVLLVLEDLTWGDLPTLRAIDGALRALENAPLMVLATARPEVHTIFPDLWSARAPREICLPELTRRASEQLVRLALGDHVAPELLAQLVERAAGNAFYLEELVRAVASGRGDALPETVLAMVQSRLDALDEESARLLRAASVFGRTFWRGGLLAIVRDAGALGLDALLASLVDRDVLVRRSEARFPGEDEYAFRHALLRETAYATLTDEDRQRAHRLAGRWLDQNGETEAVALAEHYERGGEPALAVGFYREAAAQALEGNDLDAVIARCERGVGCAIAVARQDAASADATTAFETPRELRPWVPESLEQSLGSLRLLEAEARRWRGQPTETEACAFEALALLPYGSAHWYSAAGELAWAAGANGSDSRLETVARELLALAARGEVGAAHVTTVARAVAQLNARGLGALGDQLLEPCEPVARRIARRDPAVAGWLYRARASQALRAGDPAAHIKLSETAAASFERAGDVRNALAPMQDAARAYATMGAFADAEQTARTLAASAERMGLANAAANAGWLLGRALAMRGAYEEAAAALDEAVRALAAQGDGAGLAIARAQRAALLLLQGHAAAAEREALLAAQTASDGARRTGLVIAASAALSDGRVEEALAHVEAARAITTARDEIDTFVGAVGGEGLERLTTAEVLWAAGRHDEARAEIALARDRLELRAARTSDPELRASFLAAVPENARTLRLAREWLGTAGGR